MPPLSDLGQVILPTLYKSLICKMGTMIVPPYRIIARFKQKNSQLTNKYSHMSHGLSSALNVLNQRKQLDGRTSVPSSQKSVTTVKK